MSIALTFSCCFVAFAICLTATVHLHRHQTPPKSNSTTSDVEESVADVVADTGIGIGADAVGVGKLDHRMGGITQAGEENAGAEIEAEAKMVGLELEA